MDTLAALEHASGGRISAVLYDLQTGATTAYRADEPVPTASIIKLPVLVHVALAVAEAQLAWNEQLTLDDASKCPGTGILKELSAGTRCSLRDLCMLMIALSDNTATNMIIARVGIAAINARLRQLGLARTTLLRPVFAPDTEHSRPYGLGVTTAAEMAALLVRIAQHQLGDARATADILSMLGAQQDRAAIPRYLPEGWDYAGKTGSNPDLRADVGIVTAPKGRRYVLVGFCAQLPQENWTVDNPGLLALARLAQLLLPSPNV